MDFNYRKKLIEQTRINYDLLAFDYTRTRSFISDDIRDLVKGVSFGEKILDSGCANGRLYQIINEKGADYFGIDASKKLIEIAQKKYPQAKFQVNDALNLPFSDNFFDKVFSISVIHNIPSKEFQLKYLKEIRRVLKPRGQLILRTWDFWKRKEGWKLFFKYSFLKLIGRSKLDFYDIFVPWKDSQKKIITQRYFHCFTKKKIAYLAKKSGFEIKRIWRQGKDPRTNIYIIAKK